MEVSSERPPVYGKREIAARCPPSLVGAFHDEMHTLGRSIAGKSQTDPRGPARRRNAAMPFRQLLGTLSFTGALTLLLILTGSSILYGEIARRSMAAYMYGMNDAFEGNRISIWNPYAVDDENGAGCRGSFAAPPSPHSRDSFPMALVRDAAVDDRSASRREYSEMHPKTAKAFLRVILYVTAHLSVSLLKPHIETAGSRPSLLLPSMQSNGSMSGGASSFDSGVLVEIDYILHVNPFVLKPGKYVPGMTTYYGQEVSEWQIVVSMTPAVAREGDGDESSQDIFYESMLERLYAGAILAVPIELQPFDGGKEARILFTPEMSLACVLGWQTAAPLDVLSGPRPACADRLSGAVALAGSALHGFKAKNPTSIREVAHFAARSLLGPVAFDAVAIPVIGPTSLSAAQMACAGEGESCLRRLTQDNSERLAAVAEIVSAELVSLGVPSSMFPRVILLPMCNLGSHYTGKEKEDPCKASFWANQYMALYLLYNLVGSSFKWSAAYDIDEYLSPVEHRGRFGVALRTHQAVDLFDSLNRRGHNAMKFMWLNFRVANVNTTHLLTKDLMKTQQAPHLTDPSAHRKDCYSWPTGQSLNGKAALHCETGLGFTIHAAVQLSRGKNLLESTRVTSVRSRDIRVWHPRLGGSLSSCVFKPPGG